MARQITEERNHLVVYRLFYQSAAEKIYRWRTVQFAFILRMEKIYYRKKWKRESKSYLTLAVEIWQKQKEEKAQEEIIVAFFYEILDYVILPLDKTFWLSSSCIPTYYTIVYRYYTLSAVPQLKQILGTLLYKFFCQMCKNSGKWKFNWHRLLID